MGWVTLKDLLVFGCRSFVLRWGLAVWVERRQKSDSVLVDILHDKAQIARGFDRSREEMKALRGVASVRPERSSDF